MGHCFSPWPAHTVFTSVLPCASRPELAFVPLSLCDTSGTHRSPGTGRPEGKQQRDCRPPWLRGKSRRAPLPHGRDAGSVDSAPPPPQSRLWDESWACLGVQVSVKGHSTRTSLSSAVNTTVTGALTSQSLESASALPALPHCRRPQGPLRRAVC